MREPVVLQTPTGAEIAVLRDITADMPWFEARFHPGPAWPSVRPLFEKSLYLLNSDQLDELSSLWADMEREGYRLVDAEGRTLSQFMVHVDGNRARFRYLD